MLEKSTTTDNGANETEWNASSDATLASHDVRDDVSNPSTLWLKIVFSMWSNKSDARPN